VFPEQTGRFVASDLTEALTTGAGWVKHKKQGQPEQVYKVRVEPQQTGGFQLVASTPLKVIGRKRLAMNDTKNGNRRMAGRALVQFNPDFNQDAAALKYGIINQLKGKEVHHLQEIDASNQILSAMPASLQRKAAAIGLSENFRYGDHKNNQVALWGDKSNIPGIKTRAGETVIPRSYPGKGEHQTAGGVHEIQAALMKLAGLPGPRQPDALGHKVRNLPQDSQKLAVDKIFRHSGRLAIQKRKGVNRQAQGKSYAKIYEGMADLHFPTTGELPM